MRLCRSVAELWKAANEKPSELDYVTEFYGSDFDKSELYTQLQILTSNIKDKMPHCEAVNLPEILTFVRKLLLTNISMLDSVLNPCYAINKHIR